MLMLMPRMPTGQAAAGGGDATVSFTDSDVLVSTGTSFAFPTINIGSATADRIVVVGIGTERSGASAATISAVDIGGTTAAAVSAGSTVNNGSESAALWAAVVSSGTNVTITVTTANSALACGIGVWAIYDGQTTATDSGSDTDSNPATFALDINAGGVAVAFVVHRANSATTFTTANLTEDFDQVVDTNDIYMTGASAAFASTQTNLSIEVTASQAGVRSPCLVTASFPKA